ncbi:hypothetical protein I79_005741 [Cricetulus griseus]|uniref:Uncharacterized protein n=1 Tax=Cricetulus griseus TaxID=10029 RepID=G3H5Z2_CRIGR|nr:hypothetical protein I79_005741 [Cricetulus griseus]
MPKNKYEPGLLSYTSITVPIHTEGIFEKHSIQSTHMILTTPAACNPGTLQEKSIRSWLH